MKPAVICGRFCVYSVCAWVCLCFFLFLCMCMYVYVCDYLSSLKSVFQFPFNVCLYDSLFFFNPMFWVCVGVRAGVFFGEEEGT